MTLRVLLVDDHRMFREALRALLERSPEIKIVGETGDGNEALRLIADTSPDIVCMDIGLPGMNGVETTRRIKLAHPSVKIIALSIYAERRYVLDMIEAGAGAYVTKDEASDELLRAIDAVQRNRSYLCPDVATLITHGISSRDRSIPSPIRLGNREQQVLRLVAQGNTSIQIAAKMSIAASTVEVHRRNIMRKLDLHSVAELTRYVISRGMDLD
ncbi:response regulator [Quatrionicoccus australiensis]|uniref:response regulator n=1 Tax=Quatrionicoccus australiensis TaxID=138118 RepID=UPI001CF9F430|nr:response regulator transcription factor [Quatrionicoccus australiensis]MCB4361958.1 response regulator transcription factor [Quatrionicoccus australiensis]